MSIRQYGKLAAQYGLNRPLQVCQSNAGYYIGTMSMEGEPISRESVEYYKTQLEANNALANGTWTQLSYDI